MRGFSIRPVGFSGLRSPIRAFPTRRRRLIDEVQGFRRAPQGTSRYAHRAQGTSDPRHLRSAQRASLADFFALYMKTKNFHWHVSGPHFRDYHLLLDEQADQLLRDDRPDRGAGRAKSAGRTLRSIGHIARLQRVADNDADYVTPLDMLAELREDNEQLAARMRETHDVCDEHGDVATASLHRGLDRRGRATRLVPVRGEPSRRDGWRLNEALASCLRIAAT